MAALKTNLSYRLFSCTSQVSHVERQKNQSSITQLKTYAENHRQLAGRQSTMTMSSNKRPITSVSEGRMTASDSDLSIYVQASRELLRSAEWGLSRVLY